jgi:hypothetical protein
MDPGSNSRVPAQGIKNTTRTAQHDWPRHRHKNDRGGTGIHARDQRGIGGGPVISSALEEEDPGPMPGISTTSEEEDRGSMTGICKDATTEEVGGGPGFHTQDMQPFHDRKGRK